MSYSIDNYSRSKTFLVEDGTINNSLDLSLIGKNYAGYGETLNENFLHILENFAGTTPPAKPINGQIWYDASSRKLKVWDSAVNIWRITGSAEISTIPPVGLSAGAFWWDETNKQLYVYDGNSFVLVGPQNLTSIGTTEIKSLTVTDNSSNPLSKTILVAYISGEAIYVISKEEFILSDESSVLLGGVAAFSLIKAGITLVNTTNSEGITITNKRFHGTASSALGLVDDNENLLTHNSFLKSDIDLSDFKTTIVKFGDVGYLLGDEEDLVVKIENDNNVLFRNKIGRIIKFQTRSSNEDNTPLVIEEKHLLPGLTEVTDIGSENLRFREVRAKDFYGNFQGNFTGDGSQIYNIQSSNIVGEISVGLITGKLNVDISGIAEGGADFLRVGQLYRSASVDTPDNGTPNTIPCRDELGDLNTRIFRGTATTALYADLAEKYLADQNYEVGTVVAVGGSAEVTACQRGDRAFGAVSANPAYMMNAGLVGGTYIALKGRVPIKISGLVRKGDKLIADNNGTAGVATEIMKNMQIRISTLPDTFAIALETNLDTGVKLVECIIL